MTHDDSARFDHWRARLQPLAALVFVVAIASLAQPTGFRGLDLVAIAGVPMSTLQNLLVLGAGLMAALAFGVRRWFAPVLSAALLMLVLSFTLSSRLEWLTPAQSLRTFFALSLAPFLFEIRLPVRLRAALRLIVPWFALSNLALALLLWLTTGRPMIRVDWGAIRLAGTVVPAGIALLGLVSILFSLLLARDRPRMVWLAALNYAIVVWTGTRTSMLTGAVLCYAWVLAEWLDRHRRTTFRQRLALALLVPIAVASYLPFLAQRLSGFWSGKKEAVVLTMPSDEGGFDFEFGAGSPDDSDEEGLGEPTSEEEAVQIRLTMTGRVTAWKHYFGLARENLWFGRGLGAGVVGGQGTLDRAFRLPHNEYLRLLVDGGIFGLTAMLAAYLLTLVALLRRSLRPQRVLIAAAGLVLAMESLLTNTLATQSFIIPIWLYLAILRDQQETARHEAGPSKRSP